MATNMDKIKYVPGTYAKKRPDAGQLAAIYIQDWEKKHRKIKTTFPLKIAPSICFSRKIGAGALEIADIVAEKINFRIVDREILTHISQDAKLSKETIAYFDERYPGKVAELSTMLFGEKSFILSDYIKNIFSAVFTFAEMGSNIFVGRGTHLILPRDRVLAVRVICSNEHRIKRLMKILDVEDKEAQSLLMQIDKEQRDFFKKAFSRKEASPYEFDIVINCDHITEALMAAEIVIKAFQQKFAAELDIK